MERQKQKVEAVIDRAVAIGKAEDGINKKAAVMK